MYKYVEVCHNFYMKETKEYQTSEWLIEHYIDQKLSLVKCARVAGEKVSVTAIVNALHRHEIPTRPVGHHLNGETNPMYGKHHSKAAREKVRKARTGVPRPLAGRLKQSASVSGAKNHRYGKERGHGKGSWVVTANDVTVYMRSRWEVFFADWLCEQGKEWIYEPQAFLLLDGSVYTPDFLSDGIYYEIKGWYNEEDKEKMANFTLAYPDVTLKVIDEAALRELGICIRGNQHVPSHLTLISARICTCPTCHKQFIPARKHTQYCCVGCRKKPQKRLVERTCEICGTPMMRYPSEPDRTCSSPCGQILSARSRSGENHWTARRRQE